MFSHVTEKELVANKVYCSNSRCDFTMTLRKLCWYLGQILFLMLFEKKLLQFIKIREKFGIHCSPTLT